MTRQKSCIPNVDKDTTASKYFFFHQMSLQELHSEVKITQVEQQSNEGLTVPDAEPELQLPSYLERMLRVLVQTWGQGTRRKARWLAAR